MSNPLDLNNLPEDIARDHDKDDSSPSAAGSYRKKKNGAKDESRKVYECRFCSLKFCKSQALGGHMNRHRQERETETLNRARQLVFGNDSLYQRGSSQPMVHGGHHHHHQTPPCNMGNALYPTRLFSGASTAVLPPVPHHQHLYTSPPSRLSTPPYSSQQSGKDYFMGHVCSAGNPQFIFQNLSCVAAPPPDGTNTYTCIGAPVGQVTGGSGGGGDKSVSPIHRYQKNGF